MMRVIKGLGQKVKKKPNLTLIGLVAVCSLSYQLLIQTPRYESISRVVIKSSGNESASVEGMPIPQLGMDQGRSDALLVRDYLLGSDFSNQLNEEMDLKKHYQVDNLDYITTLKSDADDMEFYEYMQERVTAEYDDYAGVLELAAQAFTAQMAEDIAEFQILKAQEFINNVNQKITSSQILSALEELNRTMLSLDIAKRDLAKFQEATNTLDIASDAQSSIETVARLEGELASLKTMHGLKSKYLTENTFELKSISDNIVVLEAQIESERSKISAFKPDSLNARSHRYDELMVHLEVAKVAYQNALFSYELLHKEVHSTLKHLIVVQTPIIDERQRYPEVLKNLATHVGIAGILLFILAFIRASLRESKD
ncbi:hypothetical protein [Vibrio barjaei]|uniref:hypothetical protein n=1 Tax=Vibrio barjaei TaxID=1676683 RepID=UPI002283E80D|nr:hypothetical protein [Vibrio barjaei]MCY9872373.1 hypothetical protein [Vibrio barjaei]